MMKNYLVVLISILFFSSSLFSIRIRADFDDQNAPIGFNVFEKPDISSKELAQVAKIKAAGINFRIFEVLPGANHIISGDQIWSKAFLSQGNVYGYTYQYYPFDDLEEKVGKRLYEIFGTYYKKPKKNKLEKLFGGWASNTKMPLERLGTWKVSSNEYIAGFLNNYSGEDYENIAFYFINIGGIIKIHGQRAEQSFEFFVTDLKWRNKNTLILDGFRPYTSKESNYTKIEKLSGEKFIIKFYGKNKMVMKASNRINADWSDTFYRVTDPKGYILPKYLPRYKKAIARQEAEERKANQPFKPYKAKTRGRRFGSPLWLTFTAGKTEADIFLKKGSIITVIGKTDKFESVGSSTYRYYIVETADGKKGYMLDLFLEKIKKK